MSPSGRLSAVVAGGNTQEQGYVQITLIDISEDVISISSCNAVGQNGPTQEQCVASYGGSRAGAMLVDVLGGVQRFRIPESGVWKVSGTSKQKTINQ